MIFSISSLRALLLLPFLAFALTMPVAAEDDESPLETEMYKMNKGYKLLGKQARKGDYDFDALGKAFTEAKAASEAAAKLVPAKVEKMSDADAKKKSIEEYKIQIAALTAQLDSMIALCKAKDGDKLKAAYDELKKAKTKGHDDFIEE